MWIFSTTGFFNIVQSSSDAGGGSLTVQAMFDGDLERLRDTYLPELMGISMIPDTEDMGGTGMAGGMDGAEASGDMSEPGCECQWQASAPRVAVQRAVGAIVSAITYADLPQAVDVSDPRRGQMYRQVSEELEDSQEEADTWAAIDARLARSGITTGTNRAGMGVGGGASEIDLTPRTSGAQSSTLRYGL
jgi:hypothetical protein